jgi:hypothetical protein
MRLRTIPHDSESVASESATDRLDDSESDRRCDRCVYCIAALLQHFEAGLCSQRLRCSDDVSRKGGDAAKSVGQVPLKSLRVAVP